MTNVPSWLARLLRVDEAMRRRLLGAGIVMSLLLSAVAYGALEKHVVVRADGKPVAVKTFARDVAGAIEGAGIRLGPHDKVKPPLSARLRDGQVVRVYRARPVTLLLNGKARRIFVTSMTVDEVLDEINLRTGMADLIRPSRSAPVRRGMTISLRRAVAVRVTHDGVSERVITNAGTVARVLREMGIRLGRLDRLTPRAGTAPKPNMEIRVARVRVRYESQRFPIRFHTVRVRDPRLEWGTKRLVSRGRGGIRVVRYRLTYVDGKRVARAFAGSSVAVRPRHRIVAVGVYRPSCHCSRGSDTGKASWYAEADGMTAAHRWLPMGTVVRVRNLANGRTVNVVIRDRGPYVDGRIIDLSDEAFARLARLGTGVIRVSIAW